MKTVVVTNKKQFFEKKMPFERRKKTLEAGYVLFVATGILCILSFFCMSVVALTRVQLHSAEKQGIQFYSELKTQNESLLAEWKGEAEKEL